MELRTKAFELAELLGWSVDDLAIRSGIPRSTLYAVKKGDRGVGPKVITGLMRAFPQTPFERLFVPAESTLVDDLSSAVAQGRGDELVSNAA